MENWPSALSDGLTDALDEAIRYQFKEITAAVAEIESESTLEDHIGSLKKLGERAAIDVTEVELAISYVTDRIDDVARLSAGRHASAPEVRSPNQSDQFDDFALKDLFIQLLHR